MKARLIHKIGAVVGASAVVALGLGVAGAVPALADCTTNCTNPSTLNASATVPATISISSLTGSSINFGSVVAGGTSLAQTVSYTISANTQFETTITPVGGADAMVGATSAADTIPNNYLSLTDQLTGDPMDGPFAFPAAGGPVSGPNAGSGYVDTESAGVYSYTDKWTLGAGGGIPAATPADAYSESFTLAAVAG